MTKNHQPVEKKTDDPDVDLHSIFRTIQGEGPFSGWPAVFVRFAGCNLQCPLCDTEYTQGRRKVAAQEVAAKVADLQTGGLVVITGGEPFRQPKAIAALCDLLTDAGHFVQIETNGSLPPPDGPAYRHQVMNPPSGVHIVVSPKSGKVVEAVECRAAAYKYVIAHGSVDPEDGLPIKALDHTVKDRVARPPMLRDGRWAVPVYVQPCDYGSKTKTDRNRNDLSMRAAVESSLEHGYIFQVQTHKIAGLE